ncbi:hypothetical protein [Proteiniclasticum sp.]|uniref:hypothetical protein n=1 Tax=Proteiniclasticum sp. TaxID=2053595 RepID=UPI0028A0ACE6|nr:hypothetical protein [Proteiniclasticum sp.]
MSYASKLPYGLRKEGDSEVLLHISEILPHESGLRCNCVCPSCGERLQAKLPKTKEDFTPRFAHHNSETCDYATETALHLKAKEIIEEEKRMVIPRVVAHYNNLYKEVTPKREVTFDRVVLERRVGNVIPDILAYKDSRPLMIEITITHGIDDEKFKKLEKLGISTLEIDLSDMDTDFDPEFLRNQIIDSLESKYWVYNAVEEKEKECLKEEYLQIQKKKEEEERKAEEKRKWLEKVREEKLKDKAERIEKLLDSNYQLILKKRWEKDLKMDPIWIKASKGMNISLNTVPEYINVDIPGEVVFGCDRRVWQAYIFYRYVNKKVKLFRDKTFPITVKRILENVKEEFKGRLNYDLVYMKDVAGYNDVPDLTQVIYDYLKRLQEYGYLLELEAGHIFYSKFIVLDPDSVYEMRFIPTEMSEYKKIENLMKNSEWDECKELIKELLLKYSQKNHPKYFDALAYLFDCVIVRSSGRILLERDF